MLLVWLNQWGWRMAGGLLRELQAVGGEGRGCEVRLWGGWGAICVVR